MKIRFTGNSHEPFALRAAEESAEDSTGSAPALEVPEGWRKLATGRRNAQLFQVSQGGSGGVHWVVAVMLNRRLVQRRFASELHARGWISLACGAREEAEEAPAGQPEEFSISARRR